MGRIKNIHTYIYIYIYHFSQAPIRSDLHFKDQLSKFYIYIYIYIYIYKR